MKQLDLTLERVTDRSAVTNVVVETQAMRAHSRRAFVRSEFNRLSRFIDVDHLVSWSRVYRCGCGFKCTDAGSIWDHTEQCKESL